LGYNRLTFYLIIGQNVNTVFRRSEDFEVNGCLNGVFMASDN
jgi:hypothetical protein